MFLQNEQQLKRNEKNNGFSPQLFQTNKGVRR